MTSTDEYRPPLVDKHAQRDLIPNHLYAEGWRSGGWDGEFYLFSRYIPTEYVPTEEPGVSRVVGGGYLNVCATDEDLKDGAKGLIWMMEHGYTRMVSEMQIPWPKS